MWEGVDISCDKSDVLRIGLSNVVMLINCLGLLYSFSPLRFFLSENNQLYPHEYIELVSMMVDILLRILFSCACIFLGTLIRPHQSATMETARPSDRMIPTCTSTPVFEDTPEDQKHMTTYYWESCDPDNSELVVSWSRLDNMTVCYYNSTNCSLSAKEMILHSWALVSLLIIWLLPCTNIQWITIIIIIVCPNRQLAFVSLFILSYYNYVCVMSCLYVIVCILLCLFLCLSDQFSHTHWLVQCLYICLISAVCLFCPSIQ